MSWVFREIKKIFSPAFWVSVFEITTRLITVDIPIESPTLAITMAMIFFWIPGIFYFFDIFH